MISVSVRLSQPCLPRQVISDLRGFSKGTCHPPSPLYVSRAAALAAGFPEKVPISTVNRLCSSGLMAIRNIAHDIQAGEIEMGLAVGVESMSLKYVSPSMFCDYEWRNLWRYGLMLLTFQSASYAGGY